MGDDRKDLTLDELLALLRRRTKTPEEIAALNEVAQGLWRLGAKVAELDKNLSSFLGKTGAPDSTEKVRDCWVDLLLVLSSFLETVLPGRPEARMALYELMRILKDLNKGIPSDALRPSPRPIAREVATAN